MDKEKLYNLWILSTEENGLKRFTAFNKESIGLTNIDTLELNNDGNFVETTQIGKNHGRFNFEGGLLYMYYKNSYDDKIFVVKTFNENELVLLRK